MVTDSGNIELGLAARRLKAWVVAWVHLVRRHAVWVVAACLLLSVGAVAYTVENLGINTDTSDMFSIRLPWRADDEAYTAAFPQFIDNMLVVIDAATPELAEEAGRRLAARVAGEADLVEWVYRPGGEPFFVRNALLYLDLDELADLADKLSEVQPFLARVGRDPSLRGLFELLAEALDEADAAREPALADVMDRTREAIDAALDDRFNQLSWQELTLGRPAARGEKRRFVIVKPKLDYGEAFPASPIIERIRRIGRDLGLDPEHGVRLRITGGIVLSNDELKSVTRGAEIASLSALVMVGIVLFVGLRSPRLVLASLLTLVVGLSWTAAFAAFALGQLNLISVAFAVLYIGLGINYAVHFCLRYQELRREGVSHGSSLETTAGDVGGSLALCALTTGAAFYSFVPTSFSGVSELGIISGTGMFISLAATLTLLPALLTLMPLPRTEMAAAAPVPPPRPRPPWVTRHRGWVLSGSVAFGAISVGALPYAEFDYNPLNLRDPDSEAITTYQDLMDESGRPPWSLVVLADGAARVAELGAELTRLEVVDSVMSLLDFVPQDQEEKLELIAELELVLGTEVLPEEAVDRPSLAGQVAAVARLRERVEAVRDDPARPRLGEAAAGIAGSLERLEAAARAGGDPAAALVERLETSLVGALPPLLERLRAGLGTEGVDLDSLPPSLVRRWRTPEGIYRMTVEPVENINDNEALRRFVAGVATVAPRATDTPAINLGASIAVVEAFKQAFLSAAVLIALLLYLLFQNVREVVLVMVPLLLAGLLSIAAMVVVGMPFNFANVIALPLLLGVGVDNGIHMVYRMRTAPPAGGNLLRTSTTRAVVTGTLTTISGFGNLALTEHRGMASMGLVLTIGLGMMLICTLVLLPVLLAGKEKPA